MSSKKIFGMPVEEVRKICALDKTPCDKNSPINPSEYLEPCIRGADKILADEEKRLMIKRILGGK